MFISSLINYKLEIVLLLYLYSVDGHCYYWIFLFLKKHNKMYTVKKKSYFYFVLLHVTKFTFNFTPQSPSTETTCYQLPGYSFTDSLCI